MCPSLLPQYLGDLGCEHIVLKNDELTVDEIAAMQPRGILVSPGPGERPPPLAMHATFSGFTACNCHCGPCRYEGVG